MRERGHPELDPNRDTPYFATGVSLVAHPHNPHAPTVHANFRYFEVKTEAGQTVAWFGGGADLTPSLVYDEVRRSRIGLKTTKLWGPYRTQGTFTRR